MLRAYILTIMESLSRNIQRENLQSPVMRRHDISLGYNQRTSYKNASRQAIASCLM